MLQTTNTVYRYTWKWCFNSCCKRSDYV